MICEPCGATIEQGQQAIFGVEREGRFVFGWTCCHKPVGDVAVILGSQHCMEQWLLTHPQYRDDVERLVAGHHHDE